MAGRDVESLSESSSSTNASSKNNRKGAHPGACQKISCCDSRCCCVFLILCMLLCISWVAYAYSVMRNLPHGGYEVQCLHVSVKHLNAPFGGALACIPQATKDETFPLNVFAHGDFLPPWLYTPLIRQLASFGFVVIAYNSCLFSWGALPGASQCHGGQGSFLEVLKTINYFMDVDPGFLPVNVSIPATVTGHSTGARAALMVAAVKDNPSYLNTTEFYAALQDQSQGLRRAANRVGSVVASHPDAMFDRTFNPDVKGYIVNATPTLILTSIYDVLFEPQGDAANDFLHITSPWSAFVDIAQGGHFEPLLLHVTGPYMALWGQALSAGNRTALDLIYGNANKSLQKKLTLAKAGDENTLDGKVGFLACGISSNGSFAIPFGDANYCSGHQGTPGRHALRLLNKQFYSVAPVLPLVLLLLACCFSCCRRKGSRVK